MMIWVYKKPQNQATVCLQDLIFSLARKSKIKFKCVEHAHCLFLTLVELCIMNLLHNDKL